MSRRWTRERWARELGTVLLAAAIVATIVARPLRRLLRRGGTGGRTTAKAKNPERKPGVEGEGSRTAARGYRKGVEEELRRAEDEGKRRSAGDLPSDFD